MLMRRNFVGEQKEQKEQNFVTMKLLRAKSAYGEERGWGCVCHLVTQSTGRIPMVLEI
jgi:hypothetical protein